MNEPMPRALKPDRDAKAPPAAQRARLAQLPIADFAERIVAATGVPLRRTRLRALQINVGKLCNQACRHCHVDAGPDRVEIMSRETMELCLAALDRGSFEIVDITGGAPELNPSFRWLVVELRRRGLHVIDRCNLTVLTLPAYRDLPALFAAHEVEIIASLPYFSAERTNAQRGDNVFEKSISALQSLNAAGYATRAGLALHLVYNPTGAFLPPDQNEIELVFRHELQSRYGITFSRLYTITNQPISRFLDYLLQSGNFESYMQRLQAAFNPAAVAGLMCRETLSVAWDGRLYDCDFNQMLELPPTLSGPRHIRDFLPASYADAPIATAPHCFACTAAQGSSCTGAIT